MNKKRILMVIFVIIILCVIIYPIIVQVSKKQTKTEIEEVSYEEENVDESEEENQKVSELIEEQGLDANESIYEIDTEYDGREVVTVKASVSYNVAVAGMLKKDMPEFSEINEILEKAPNHTGVWVEESTREKLLKVLNNIGNGTYEIDEDGYLLQTVGINANKYDKRIKEMLTDGFLHVFYISSVTYLVDTVTGEIQEYPFEEMDPYTDYEYFLADKREMFVISEGKLGEVNSEDIIKAILETE